MPISSGSRKRSLPDAEELQRRFRAHLKRARIICLDIHAFMQPELAALLEKKVAPFL